MSDGKELTGKKSNWTIAHAFTWVVDTLTGNRSHAVITWKVKGAGEITLDMSKLHADNVARAAVHGMVQRISDAAAIARDATTGRSATPEEKLAAMQKLVEHYMSGNSDWSVRREGSGESRQVSGAGLLREILAIAYPEKSAERIAEYVSNLSRAQVTTLINSEQLKVARDTVNAKYQPRNINAAEVLAGLDDAPQQEEAGEQSEDNA